MNEENPEEDREMEEPQEPIDPPHENNYYKRKLAWVREAIQGVERYGLQKKCTERGKEPGPTLTMYHYYVTSLIKNLPTMKKRQKRKNRRML